MQKTRFYSFQFESGSQTTSGSPNQTTGRYNIAGAIYVFNKKVNAEKWAALNNNCTVRTKSELRKKCLGISVQDFNMILKTANAYDEGEE